MYAIVRSGSKQQKVAVGDVIQIDKTNEEVGAEDLGIDLSTLGQTGPVRAQAWTVPHLHPALDPAALQPMQTVQWTSFDGRRISGLLMRPAARFDGRRPVLIDIHGGPEGQSRVRFGGRDNLLTNEMGIAVLITDHHLPAEMLPEADCIVNPNQPGCAFPSKCIAGVGVMFYVMLALRAELRERGFFIDKPEPNFASLLDLVALGTVADVVSLDHNNRVLVSQGLQRIRQGRLTPGLRALFGAAGRNPAQASSFDLGFMIGPRLNAAGRLSDMSLGIECLITDDQGRALHIAQQLDALNRERREIEAGMQEQALLQVAKAAADLEGEPAAAVSLFDPDWHQGVVGIVAARIKERLHRPVFAFARGDAGEIKGSGRSIPGLHLRDALDLVSKRAPGLLLRFGGHAMAAGLTLRESDFARFRERFAQVADELLAPADRTRTLETDGGLAAAYFSVATARLLEAEVWGQGFPAPLFQDEFEVESQRILKDKHLKLRLRKGMQQFDAIQFNFRMAPGNHIRAAYRLAINDFNGVQTPQLMIEHIENRAA